MTILQLPFVQGMIRMAHEGYTRGWHERNGGNLSYRLLPQEVAQTKDGFSPRDWEPIGASVPSLGGGKYCLLRHRPVYGQRAAHPRLHPWSH